MWKQEKNGRQAVRLLSSTQAAAYLGCSVRTIKRLMVTGELPVLQNFKYYRYDINDLDALVERHKVVL
jgi:excisionase family DNA binding protein